MKFVIQDAQGRKRLELDMLGVPRIGDSLDVFEFLPVNERHKYRHAKVVDCWWEPDRNRTLCPRLVVEYGPLPQQTKGRTQSSALAELTSSKAASIQSPQKPVIRTAKKKPLMPPKEATASDSKRPE